VRIRGRRRLLFGAGVVAAVVLLVGGGVVAYLGYTKTSGPDGAVRGYFAALAAGDASGALAYGDVPRGPHGLLTDQVLTEQQRIAAIKQFSIRGTTQTGARAQVKVRYMLDFPGDPQQVDSTVPVYQRDGDWRLSRVAVATQLLLPKAAARASILGTRISAGTVLVFPGAAPVRLDTPYLKLSAAQSGVDFDSGATTEVDVVVTDAGRRQADELVAANLLACVSGRGPRTCPLPDSRYVPGSLRGRLASAHPALTVSVDDSAAGVIEVTGSASVVGTYRRLSFQNRVTGGQGSVVVPIRAQAYAVSPLRFSWTRP
jgi:hypothetical protein